MSPARKVMSSGCEIASRPFGVACMMFAPLANTRAVNTDRRTPEALRPWAGRTAATATTPAAATPTEGASERRNETWFLMGDLFSVGVVARGLREGMWATPADRHHRVIALSYSAHLPPTAGSGATGRNPPPRITV